MSLESLEERHWLGPGHARTAHTRDRVQSSHTSAWEIWQQWSKVKQPGPSRNNMPREDQPFTEQIFQATTPPALPHRSNTPFAASSPRRRSVTAARRRLNQRTPPSQRQSQLASLTERFIVIEEKRLDNERLVIENQRKMLDVFQAMSEAWTRQAQAMNEAWTRQAQAMQDLCETIRQET